MDSKAYTVTKRTLRLGVLTHSVLDPAGPYLRWSRTGGWSWPGREVIFVEEGGVEGECCMGSFGYIQT